MAEDLIARYELDVSNLKLQVKELESQFAKLTDAETKSAKAGEEGFKKTGKAAEEAKEKNKLFASSVESIGSAIVGAFAVERVISFAKESVKAFAEAEASAKKLQTAVSVSGGLNKDFENLIAQSSQLQELTIFSDDDIQAAQTAALQYGFTAEQVQKLIPTLTDLASATGTDLQSALSSVISATEGSERALRSQGVVVDNSISKADNFNSIIAQLNKTFEGQAIVVGETAAGALKKYDNQIGELQEQVGEKLLPSFEALKLGALAFARDLLNAFSGDLGKGDTITEKIQRDTLAFEKIRSNLNTKEMADIIEKNKVTLNYNGMKMQSLKKESEEYKTLSEENQRLLNWQKLYSDEILKRTSVVTKGIDYEKLGLEELKKKRDELKVKSDFNSRSELEQVEKVIKKREDQSKKQKDLDDKTAADQKSNLSELEKLTEDAYSKLNEIAAKSEEEKFNKQREAALKQAEELFKGAGGSANLKAVEEFKKAELAINAEYDALIKQSKIKSIESTYASTKTLIKQNSDDELQATLSAIDDSTNQQILAAKKAYLEKGVFTKEAEKKLQDEITKIQLQAEKDRIENSKTIREAQIEDEKNAAINAAFQKAIIENNGNVQKAVSSQQYIDAVTTAEDEANKKKTKSDQTYAKEKNALDQKTTDNAINNAEAESDGWLGRNQAKIDAAYKAASEIMAAYDAILQSQIKAKEDELTALKESYDAEDEELQNRYDKRLIGAGDFEKQQAIIKQQRIASEKKIQAELNKLKHQEDVANRAKAIFEIILNTSVAVAKLLDTPFLAIMAGIAGAAQLTTILATPLPKYAKGTKYLQRGNNPFGVDTIPIMANEGERIIPTDRNKKYWSIYEAIDSGKWNDFVNQKYIAPALKNQLAEFKKSESASFAENISNSLVFNHGLLAEKIGSEIEWRNRNGIKVKGMDQLIDALNSKTDIRKR